MDVFLLNVNGMWPMDDTLRAGNDQNKGQRA